MRIWSAGDGTPLGLAYRHRGTVISVACSADGSRVLTADQEAGARLWRLDRSARLGPESFRNPAEMSCAAFSPSGRNLAVGDANGTVQIWQVRGAKREPVSLSHGSPIAAVAFSPDSAALATACEDGSISLWSSRGARLEFSVRHNARVRVLQFSPDGNLLASGSDDRMAQLWRLDRAESVGQFRLRGSVHSLAFSPDGRLLATGGADQSAKVWSVDTGKELGLSLEHPSAVTTIAHHPHDDRWLSGFGKSVHLWRLQRVWRSEDSAFASDPSIIDTLHFGNRVEFVSFNRAGDGFLAVTDAWLHYFSISEDGAVPISSRLLPGTWMGALRWCGNPSLIDVALLDCRNSFRVFRLGLDLSDVPPVEGNPEDLLFEWEARLGQHVDENARIAPSL
jgi:WD40 repeat protein